MSRATEILFISSVPFVFQGVLLMQRASLFGLEGSVLFLFWLPGALSGLCGANRPSMKPEQTVSTPVAGLALTV